ncbi:MAG: Aldehyde-alcohol dehydrogenase [Chloroflexi bacterium ADurb.Bin120]|jgi:acetaldehyde dehydrogenase (acetylating)|uniref:Acetaldehyde dehydrogenase n=1 Tax=Candidatus Brevifilum fermentans TaxID=1986204 RepID=A0A1Y6K9R7_9CHLR|nr:aldehyde dehydrogenase family protein [Brevefilum fermentans]MDI9565748.1 aldehyde dehydrogenase family protein [Chloroflexota bacterium]OQB83415.1 MAG: Aldehyde-alcohol dehydrogenase [Chloroflexi bacterium ADurb.Bin120]SMX54780.1 Acetaldehyde dehydrogenase [Brevefilum fermentans]HOM66460.1 aldehyde dehydrogenase family protein [Brevefilum fermentans]HPX95049.1 aldehyde dehydrogenase family protein [Brevefilum fermentans]
MSEFDHDLQSIQEARDLASRAFSAWKQWSTASQEQVDRVCAAMAAAAQAASERLGAEAHQETGFGVAEHKHLKNIFASKNVWESIQNLKTVGIIGHDPEKKIYDIAWPVGVIAALTPSTNPTSTVMFKVLVAVKARDAIIIAPHPSAARCSYETTRIMAQAAEENGAPPGLISCMQHISLQGTQALMQHKYVALILATGGTPMVRAAHSTGKPAYGVGPGNVPVYVDRSADLEKAARYIVASKAFDCSTICATEQAVVADRPIADQLAALMEQEGAYFANREETDRLRKLLFHPDGSMNVATVGKSAQYLAGMTGLSIPSSARIIVTRLEKTGKDEPLSREKLTTVLGWYEEEGWEAGCERCIELIQFGGRGHSLIIHATDQDVIMAFGLEKPVFRIAVNTMGTLGAIGLTTGVMPSMTLGAGGVGGSITGDNITASHLFNVKRLAFELSAPPAAAMIPGKTATGPSAQEIERAVREALNEILKIGT